MIGNFDDSHLVFGCLPACLKNGDFPDSYSMVPNGARRPYFPIYNGKAAPVKLQGLANIYNASAPNNWKIAYNKIGAISITCDHDDGSFTGGIIKNLQLKFTSTSQYTWAYWLDFSNPYDITWENGFGVNTVVPGATGVLAPIQYADFETGSFYNQLFVGISPGPPANQFISIGTVGIATGGISYWSFPLLDTDLHGLTHLVVTLNNGIFRLFLNNSERLVSTDPSYSSPIPPSPELPDEGLYWPSTVFDSSTFYYPPDNLLFTFSGDYLFEHGDVSDPVLYNMYNNWTVLYQQFPAESLDVYMNYCYSQMLFNKALSQNEINNLYSLGPDLGRLLGYDNGDGTMSLFPPSNDIKTSINVYELTMNVGEPYISDSTNYQYISIPYVGISDPLDTNVSIISYEYSLDAELTWTSMTVSGGTQTTGLSFDNITSYIFNWSAKHDLGSNIYNTPIWIRFKVTGTLGNSLYISKNIKFERTLNIPSKISQEQFPKDYSGVYGTYLLSNAPKIR